MEEEFDSKIEEWFLKLHFSRFTLIFMTIASFITGFFAGRV